MISLLTCGISMAHYTWYNLSVQGKEISCVAFSIFGALAEGFVFANIGLTTFTYINLQDGNFDEKWSISLIGWMCLIIIVGRSLAVFLSHGCFRLCSKKSNVSLRELCFITYGGMIRGAIAYGLVMKIPNSDLFPNAKILQTSTLALVIISTLFFGTFMKFA